LVILSVRISQGSVETHLRQDEKFYRYTLFPWKSVSERILKFS